MQYSLNYSGTRFLSTEIKITQFPGGFRLNHSDLGQNLRYFLSNLFTLYNSAGFNRIIIQVMHL